MKLFANLFGQSHSELSQIATIARSSISTIAIHTAIEDEDDGFLYLVPQLIVDETEIVDLDGAALDLAELQRSVDRDGEFFIFTCWCGDPGCGGINAGVCVSHKGDIVTWEVPQLVGVGRSQFTFLRSTLIAALENGVAEARELFFQTQQTTEKKLEIVPDINTAVLGLKTVADQ